MDRWWRRRGRPDNRGVPSGVTRFHQGILASGARTDGMRALIPDEVGDVFEIGPDGVPTAASLAATEAAAREGDPADMANHAVALQLAGRDQEARPWLERAWAAGNAVAGFNLGTLHLHAGDTRRAEEVWRRAAALGDPDALLGLIRIALRRGDRAAQHWTARLLASDAPYPITALGVTLRGRGDLDGAARAFERSVELGDPHAMDHLADLLGPTDSARATNLRTAADMARSGRERPAD